MRLEDFGINEETKKFKDIMRIYLNNREDIHSYNTPTQVYYETGTFIYLVVNVAVVAQAAVAYNTVVAVILAVVPAYVL